MLTIRVKENQKEKVYVSFINDYYTNIVYAQLVHDGILKRKNGTSRTFKNQGFEFSTFYRL